MIRVVFGKVKCLVDVIYCTALLCNFCFTDATAHSNAAYGQNADIIIALDDLACTTAQSRLIDCTYDSNTADCSHSDDAGVACVAREFLFEHCFDTGIECLIYS